MFAEGYEAKRRLQARGRMKPGTMNKTEKAYSLYLKAEQSAGRVEQFWFESVKLKNRRRRLLLYAGFHGVKAGWNAGAPRSKGEPSDFSG